jgi:hypothetical protein
MRTTLIAAVAAALLSACGSAPMKRPPPAPALVEVVVKVFVPIDPELTRPCVWRPSAPLEEIPSVARERKKCLQFYEANLDAIRRVQGGPVPNPEPKK